MTNKTDFLKVEQSELLNLVDSITDETSKQDFINKVTFLSNQREEARSKLPNSPKVIIVENGYEQ